MLKKIIMAMLVMSIASAVMAQNHYMLTGQLSDSKGQPLPYTNCVLLNAADSSFACGTTSDLDGVFSLANIKQGHYLLRVSAIGYDTHWQTINMDKDTSLGTIVVESNATMLSEIKTTPVCKAAMPPMHCRTPQAWKSMPRAISNTAAEPK